MKTYALVVVGLLTSVPLVANAENTQQGPVALDAVQLDSVTAAGFTLPGTYIEVLGSADATGRNTQTGTHTNALVKGFPSPAGFGFGGNFALASSVLVNATGEVSRDTSVSTSDETNGTTRLGTIINRTMTFGSTTVTGYSSVQPTGLTTHNVLSVIEGWGWW